MPADGRCQMGFNSAFQGLRKKTDKFVNEKRVLRKTF
jgi:hypothetical protein